MFVSSRPAPVFEVEFRTAEQVLANRWGAHITARQLADHYADLMVMAHHHQNCRYWLLDLRRHNWQEPPFGEWFSRDFAPSVHGLLGRPLFIAYVVYEAQAGLVSRYSRGLMRKCAAYDVYPYFFTAEAAANGWLQHQRSLDADPMVGG